MTWFLIETNTQFCENVKFTICLLVASITKVNYSYMTWLSNRNNFIGDYPNCIILFKFTGNLIG